MGVGVLLGDVVLSLEGATNHYHHHNHNYQTQRPSQVNEAGFWGVVRSGVGGQVTQYQFFQGLIIY